MLNKKGNLIELIVNQRKHFLSRDYFQLMAFLLKKMSDLFFSSSDDNSPMGRIDAVNISTMSGFFSLDRPQNSWLFVAKLILAIFADDILMINNVKLIKHQR